MGGRTSGSLCRAGAGCACIACCADPYISMRRRVLNYLAIWAAWSVPAAFTTAIALSESGLTAHRLIVLVLPWYYWALVTMPIVRHAYAHPLETLRTPRGAIRHLLVAILAGVACGIANALASIAFETAGRRSPEQMLIYGVLFWAVFGLIFYTLITAVGFAIAAQEKLREREVATSKLEARLVEAQLSGLRMQLQPHFLFNTLNTAAMYVRDGDASTSIRVLTRLSELLRRVLDTGSEQEVPLGLELEHVQRYLEIEALRFADRLRVEVDVDPSLHSALVPNLALQPLVENGIRHGIAKRAAGGVLRVSARREADRLVVGIYNDGPCLPDGWSSDAAEGIGLRNTQLRMQHLYDGGSTLTLRNQANGVLCEMVVPYRV